MLQPAGIMVVLRLVVAVGKGNGNIDFCLILGLVRTVAHLALRLPELYARQRIFTGKLLRMVDNPFFIAKFRCLKACRRFIAEDKTDAFIDNGLALDHIHIIFYRYLNIRKNLHIGLPANFCAGFSLTGFLVKAAGILAALKVKRIPGIARADIDIHVLRSVLRCTKAEAIEPKRILVAAGLVVMILAARIHLTKNQLPVIALFVLVKIHRNAAAVVLDLDRMIQKARDRDLSTEALACFVD